MIAAVVAFDPEGLLLRLAKWFVFLFPDSDVPTFLSDPSLAATLVIYITVYGALILLAWPFVEWIFSKAFPHLTKRGRFTLIMESRTKFVDHLNQSRYVDEKNYQAAYDKFTELRVECLKRMKQAGFRPENWGRMERIGSFQGSGPNKYSAQIRSMCDAAINVIKETIDDEKRDP